MTRKRGVLEKAAIYSGTTGRNVITKMRKLKVKLRREKSSENSRADSETNKITIGNKNLVPPVFAAAHELGHIMHSTNIRKKLSKLPDAKLDKKIKLMNGHDRYPQHKPQDYIQALVGDQMRHAGARSKKNNNRKAGGLKVERIANVNGLNLIAKDDRSAYKKSLEPAYKTYTDDYGPELSNKKPWVR